MTWPSSGSFVSTKGVGYNNVTVSPVTWKEALDVKFLNGQLYSCGTLNMQTVVDNAGGSPDGVFNGSRFRAYIMRWAPNGIIDTTFGAGGLNIWEDYTQTTFGISSISWSASGGGTVTVNTSSAFTFTTGNEFNATVSGVTPSGYNGTFVGTVTGASSFTYPLVSNPGAGSGGNLVVYSLANIEGETLAVTADGHPLLSYIRFNPYTGGVGLFTYGVTRWNTDGTLDRNFGSFGQADSTNNEAANRNERFQVAVASTGEVYLSANIISAGTNGGNVRAWLPTGIPGAGVNNNESRTETAPAADAPTCAIDANGNVLIAGAWSGGIVVTRLLPTTSATPLIQDVTFGPALAITSMVTTGTGPFTVTVTTTAPHNLQTNGDPQPVAIAGVSPSGYNGTQQMTRTGASTFTFSLVSNPGTVTVQGTYKTGYNIQTLTNGGSSPNGSTGRIIVLPSGKILVTFYSNTGVVNQQGMGVMRLNSDGTLDTGFGTSGFVGPHWSGSGVSGVQITDQIYQCSFLDLNNNIVTAGWTYKSAPGSYFAAGSEMVVQRFTPAGVLDTTFNSTGVKAIAEIDTDTSTNEQIYGGCVDPNTGEYIFGIHYHGTAVNTPTNVIEAGLIKMNSSSGALDTAFGLRSGSSIATSPFQGNASPPSVTTSAVTNIATTTATANATINPNGKQASWCFVYGLASGKYHYKSAVNIVGSGSSGVVVSVGLTGLTGGVTYYGRAVAWSSDGVGLDTLPTEVSWTGTGTGIIFEDNFNDTNGTQVWGYHFPDINLIGSPWQTIVAGGSGSVASNAAQIQSNVLAPQGTGAVQLISGGGTGAAGTLTTNCPLTTGYVVSATFTRASGSSPLVVMLRYTGNQFNNFWSVVADGTNFYIFENVSGTGTVRATASQSITNGTAYTIQVTTSGTTITATINGGNSISYNTFSSLSSQLGIGLNLYQNVNVSNFTIQN